MYQSTHHTVISSLTGDEVTVVIVKLGLGLALL